MSIAFQQGTFQTVYPGSLYAFQGADRYVDIPASSLLSINGSLSLSLYRAGTLITFSVGTRDPSTIPPLKYNVDDVQITIYNPDSSLRIDSESMFNVSTGEYIYTLQTTTTDDLGSYSGYVEAINGSYTFITLTTILFILKDF